MAEVIHNVNRDEKKRKELDIDNVEEEIKSEFDILEQGRKHRSKIIEIWRQDEEEHTREGSDSDPIKTEESDNGVKAEDEISFPDCEVKKEVSKTEPNTYDEIDCVTSPDNIPEKDEAEMNEGYEKEIGNQN